MALDEVHAIRLSTIVTVVEAALVQIDVALRATEDLADTNEKAEPLTMSQVRQLRRSIGDIKSSLRQAEKRFSVRPVQPEPRQVIVAELSALWVTLLSSKPEMMKGYGREFDPHDKKDWERMIHDLLSHVESMRKLALEKVTTAEG